MSTITTNRNKSHMLLAQFDNFDKVTRSVEGVVRVLKDIQMIDAFGDIAVEHNLSAPLVATIRAVPGFMDAVKSFPEASLFSIVPEHKSSLNQIQGLEALSVVQEDNVDSLRKRASAVATSVAGVIEGLSEVVSIYQEQLSSDKTRIEALDIPEDMLTYLPVYTMSEEGFSKFFGMLEKYLKEVSEFNPDHLRENPNELRQEIDALTDIVGDLGDALGIAVNEWGVHEKNKSDEYSPSASTFGEKGITKTLLLGYLARAHELCDILKNIYDRKDDIIEALNKACDEIPVTLNSNEVEYGANEHFILFSCYATLTTKLIREAIVLIARLVTAADSVIELEANCTEEDKAVATRVR